MHALYWPVPGIRHLLRQLSLSAEQACDDLVLASGAPAHSYAAMLLRLARGTSVPATVSLGHDSELGIRIRYMVVEIVDHGVGARGAIATFVACAVLTTPLAAVQLASRPELPVQPLLPWGSVDLPGQKALPGDTAATMQFDESVLTLLEPGPQRPPRPPDVAQPPQVQWQEKPSIPPP